MADYRRYRVAGGTYFFTINLLERRSDLLMREIDVLREAVRRTPARTAFFDRRLGGVARAYALHHHPARG